jgi:hypothetical protein
MTSTEQVHDRAEWWNFERLSHWDPTHPSAAWAAHLLQEAAMTRLPCPRCGVVASVRTNLNHLLRDHRSGYAEAAAWLEDADADLFALAVHYLATKARAERRTSQWNHPVQADRRPRGGLLPGWCRTSSF